jgi:hypothetical protein
VRGLTFPPCSAGEPSTSTAATPAAASTASTSVCTGTGTGTGTGTSSAAGCGSTVAGDAGRRVGIRERMAAASSAGTVHTQMHESDDTVTS